MRKPRKKKESPARSARRAGKTGSARVIPLPRAGRRRPGKIEVVTDPVESAKVAGLRYVSDTRPGIRRKRAGAGFSYVGLDGKPIRDPKQLERIRSLGIPPAWTDVWICAVADGHLQATGRDAKRRKQYRYHPRWREVRDETKYERMLAFAEALPRIRARTEGDLALPGLPRNKVLATVVNLLERTLIRIGNEEYAHQNDSFGLTTLRDHHVEIDGPSLRFRFRGKSGKEHDVGVTDKRLARIVARCQDVPGDELFQYIDEQGERQTVESSDVNDYLREITGEDFTAKDFRTWAGTVLALRELLELEPWHSKLQARKNLVQVIKYVAERLGNTPTVCRKCYVHPAVMEAYLDGVIANGGIADTEGEQPLHALRGEEGRLVRMLQKLAHAAESPGAMGSTPAA